MTAVAFSIVVISPDVIARSVPWYADDIEQAKTTQASCNVRVKNGGTLPDDVLEECRNANDAMLHAHNFTPSKPMSRHRVRTVRSRKCRTPCRC
jgi:hypothetical protein